MAVSCAAGTAIPHQTGWSTGMGRLACMGVSCGRDARAPGARGACPTRARAGRLGGEPHAGQTVSSTGAGPSMYHVLWLTSLYSSLYWMGRPSGMDFIGRGEDERLHGRFLSAYLSVEEMRAVLNAPNLHHCDGIRDRAMLH